MRTQVMPDPSDYAVHIKCHPDPDMLARRVLETVVQKCAEQVAEKFMKRHGDKLLAAIDKEDIKAYCKVVVAKKVWSEFSEMSRNADPFSRAIPEIAKSTKKEIAKILSV